MAAEKKAVNPFTDPAGGLAGYTQEDVHSPDTKKRATSVPQPELEKMVVDAEKKLNVDPKATY